MSVISCMTPDESQDNHDEVQQIATYERCESNTWQNDPSSQEPIPPESVPYYYEDISRETADLVLWDRGCVDGMYLLRKSTNKDADFVLSLCFNNSVLHYRLRTFPDGLVGLTGMPRQKFLGPVELINNVEGVACKPRIPCCRIASQFCGDLYFGLTKEEVRKIMKQKAQEWDIQDDKLDSQQNENYGDLKSLMLKTVHEYQPWFHGNLSREEAEKLMETFGHSDGKFLVRERDDCSYALCVSVSRIAKHYKIDVLPSGEFAIQAGQKFPNLMALVRHYMVCSDGLKVVLKQPCAKPDSSDTPTVAEASVRTDIEIGTEKKKSDSKQVEDDSPAHAAAMYQGAKMSSVTLDTSSSNIYSNLPIHSATSTSKLLSDWEKSCQPRKISLPDTHRANAKPRTEANSQRRLSSPPGSIQSSRLTSPTSSRKLVDELHNLSVMMPGDAPHSQETGNENLDKVPPVPAPRLSLNSRSRSVDGDLQTKLDANTNSNSDMERQRSSSLHPSVDSALPAEPTSALLGGFLHKLFGRVQKSLGHSDPDTTSNDHIATTDKVDSSSKKTPMSPLLTSDDVARSANPRTHDKCPNISKKPQLPPKIGEDPLKKDRPLPLPRKRITKDVKNVTNFKQEESLPKLSLIEENPAVPPSRSAKEEVVAHNDDVHDECQSESGQSDKSVTSQENGKIPINEPLYVEIDPTIEEEESNDSQLTVNWETNVEYEPMSSPQLKGSSLSRSESAPGQHPLLKHATEEEKSSSPCTGGAKPKVIIDNDKKLARSKSISPRSKNISSDISDTGWDDEPRTPPPVPLGVKLKRRWSKEKSESIYRTIRRHRKNYINLDRKAIKLEEKIGSGNFGDVMRATYSSNNGEMDLAIKTLKPNSIAKQKNEILKEARTMARFDHCHIVRLIGVCEGDPFMLVMELAPLGPLHKFLKKHSEISINDIIMLIEQVAMAMEYLESKQYVHRDLAARNVLLVNDKFVKISDFGMSRALGIGRDYYRAAESGKWPLKWYAPECIYYFKFSSKSDVWSFGVTLWEALSYGEKPYKGMVGKEILEMFYRNERLSQPRCCPDGIYELMWKCWQMKPEERPSFSELRQTLHNFTSS